jgi:hypothetical protein
MSIQIGKSIYSLLSNDSIVKGFVNDKIYPIDAPENTLAPFIVYERSSDVEFSRDGVGISNSQIDIYIVSETYEGVMDITLAVYRLLNLYNGEVAGNRIIDMRLINVDETSTLNSYVQKLTFTCKSV